MTRGYLFGLFALTAMWGASYLFIKVAIDEIEPIPMMALRLVLAALVVLPFLVLRRGARGAAADLRGAWRPGLFLGVFNMAIPFTLIGWGEKHVDSGVAAIATSTVPIFIALLAIRYRQSERADGLRLVGILVGLVGVGVLTGAQPEGGWWAVAGTLACVLASLAYAVGGLYGQGRSTEYSGTVLASASILGGLVVLLPFSFFQLPDRVPSAEALGSIAALGVAGTGIAQLFLFRMLRLYGSARTTLVTYLLPVAALFYGALLLDEPLRAAAIGGLALILAGVALGARRPRFVRPAVEPAP